MPTLLIKVADGIEEERTWVGQLTIGSGAGNDVRLESADLSDRHAKLFETATGAVEIEDAGSTDGVFVNGQRILSKTLVQPQMPVSLGKVRLTLKSEARVTRAIPRVRPVLGSDVPRRRDPNAPRPARTSGPLSLVGQEGPHAGKRYVVRGKLTVGRVPGNDVLLEDDSVSRRHAEVDRTGDQLILRDLGSANGTLVNGDRISGERLLRPGDVVSFGVVDFRLEGGPGTSTSLAARGAAGAGLAGGGSGRAIERSDQKVEPSVGTLSEPGTARSRRSLYVTGGLLAVLLFVGALIKVFTAPPHPNDSPLGLGTQMQAETVEQVLTRCRAMADSEGQNEPNWRGAQAACENVRERDPINQEVSDLLRRIEREEKNKDFYDRGRKALDRDRAEDALDWFKKLPASSWYFVRARANVDAIRKDLLAHLGRDCRKYSQASLYPQALPSCERYMELICQEMNEDELRPPPGAPVDIGPRPIKGAWRPKDVTFLDFLRAREKAVPGSPMWQCPNNEMFRSGMGSSGADAGLETLLKKAYPDEPLRHAVLLYSQAKQSDAEAGLFRVREDIHQAGLHASAESLRKDVNAVQQLYNAGESALQVDDVESAAESFREALELDQKLMGANTVDVHPSIYRLNIRQDMALKTYKKGAEMANHQDRRRACAAWKLGWSFYKGSMELGRAIQVCTTWASQIPLTSCQKADEMFALAATGDGFDKRAQEYKHTQNCP